MENENEIKCEKKICVAYPIVDFLFQPINQLEDGKNIMLKLSSAKYERCSYL
jgi:hypothetical protein